MNIIGKNRTLVNYERVKPGRHFKKGDMYFDKYDDTIWGISPHWYGKVINKKDPCKYYRKITK